MVFLLMKNILLAKLGEERDKNEKKRGCHL
jgi:hypothetical protein